MLSKCINHVARPFRAPRLHPPFFTPKHIIPADYTWTPLAHVARNARALADCPLIVIRPGRHVRALVKELWIGRSVDLADLDVIVVPAKGFAGLHAWDEFGAGNKEEGGSEETSSHQVNGIVMAQIHGGPPDPQRVQEKQQNK